MQLSDRDINAIKSILEASRKKSDFNMAAAASEKIRAHLKIDSSMSPFAKVSISVSKVCSNGSDGSHATDDKCCADGGKNAVNLSFMLTVACDNDCCNCIGNCR